MVCAFFKKLAEIQHALMKATTTDTPDERLAVANKLHKWLLTGFIDRGLVIACRHPVVQAILALNVLRLYLDVFGDDLKIQRSVYTADRVQLLLACQASEFTEVRARARSLSVCPMEDATLD